jgi:hypothetical protein
MSRPLAPCGTRAAYDRHFRRGEPVDEACRLAAREYYRKNYANPAVRQKRCEDSNAYGRALARLRDEHPDRFLQIYAEEKAAS